MTELMMETTLYIDIFEEFLRTQNDPHKKLMWELKSIIKLMQMDLNNEDCQNALRMILNLFQSYEIEPWEISINQYDESKKLSDDVELVKIMFDEVS